MVKFKLLFLLVFFCYQHVENEKKDFILEVKIEGLKPGKGLVRVCLFNSEDTFFNKALICEVKDVPQDSQSIILKFEQKLQEGKYAITVYQDLNKNGILDRNWLGLPSEPYGFSNNPSTFFGPPSFQKAAFYISENHSIRIKL